LIAYSTAKWSGAHIRYCFMVNNHR
jgi:hypothetical protein